MRSITSPVLLTAGLAALSGGSIAGLPALAAPSLAELDRQGLQPVEARPEAPAPLLHLRGATVLTAAGQRFEPGYLVLADGLIREVGPGSGPEVPGATVLDLPGRYVTPGLIDTHSHLGVYPSPEARAHGDGNEATQPTTPGVWAEHSVWPQDPGFQRAIAGGVTALQILPGSANLVGGRGVVLEVVPARGARAMRFPGAPETLKMACGENPKRVYGEKGGPSTRMGNLRGQREIFFQALEYQRRWAEWEAKAKAEPGKRKEPPPDPGPPPDRDLDLETLVGLLEGRVLAQVHCYRADDMLSFLQLADEAGFRVRGFHHALEAYKIRDVLAEREVSVSTWADWWGFKLEAYDGIPENAALVEEAGGRTVIHSDSADGIQRLNQEAAKAYYAGLRAGIRLTEDDALRWITVEPAWTLGIDHLTGSLSPGLRADVVVWDAHPFEVTARAEQVFVRGIERYRLGSATEWSDFEIGQELGQ